MDPFLGALIYIVVALAVAGLLLWGIQQVPMDPTIAKLIRTVVIIVVCLWCLAWILRLAGVAMPWPR